MKIDLLPIGARFQWKGRTHTKIGPMTATSDAGGSVFIPKHAVLAPVPGETPPPLPQRAPAEALDPARVAAAFDLYHQTAVRFVDATGRAMLEAARKRFLSEIR